jgi:carbon-monoxide dehydrogenase medium subunit
MRFTFHQPTSIDAAINLAREFGETGRFIAGGTDLIIQMNRKRLAPRHIISLSGLDLDTIVETPTDYTIGALTTHAAIESHPGFQRQLVALAEASRVIGGRQVRNIATVGGNIVNASPAADLVPVLLTLDASVELKGSAGSRTMPLDQFLIDRGQTRRGIDEILTAVRFSKPSPASATVFLKAGRRKAMEISVVCIAAHLVRRRDGQGYDKVRIAIGAAASKTFRPANAEAFVQREGEKSFREAGRLAAESAAPISDVRSSARYRKLLVATLVERALIRCHEQIGKVDK